jgi:CBS domain-containing protein
VKIRDVMTPDIEVVTPDDALRTAAQLMTGLGLDPAPGQRQQLPHRHD